MKRIYFNSAIIFLIFLVVSVASVAESGPPQRQLKTYALNGNVRSADISPDETLVATQITRLDSTKDPSKNKALELVQLWDFRQDRLVAEAPLTEVVTDKDHPSQDYSTPRFTRFTGDGKILVAYLDHTMYVLSGTDLRELRKIPMSGPAEEVRSYKDKSGVHPFVIKPNLQIFEVSPVGHKVAAIWDARLFVQSG